MQTEENHVNLELMNFVETQILPRYTTFGPSHGLAHVKRVIERSLVLARKTGANQNMAYIAAAYHDLGMSGPRAIHHLTGGKILQADQRLRKWFTEDQVKIMREAVEDHRASGKNPPRTIYGAIVAEADAATRQIWWSRELLDEVGHAALDLLDISLSGIHAALELGNPLDLIKPVQQHLAKHARSPTPKPHPFW